MYYVAFLRRHGAADAVVKEKIPVVHQIGQFDAVIPLVSS